MRRGLALIGAALALGGFAVPCMASPIRWSAPGLVDQRLPFAVPEGITDLTCPSVHLCVGTQAGGVEISRHPLGGASAWRVTALRVTPSSPLGPIACASPRLCVAVGYRGQVFTSTNPTGGTVAWRRASVRALEQATALSCPRVRFCIALAGMNVVVSTNPTRASSWRAIRVSTNGAMRSVACPSKKLCVATAGFAGDAEIWTTTSPTGPGQRWKAIDTPAPGLNFDPSGVACPSTRLCVVTDEAGNVLTSTDPAHRRWKSGRLPGLGPDSTAVLPARLTCPSVHLCLSLVGPQAVAVSTHPAGGAHTWRTSGQPSTSPLTGALTCASARLCVAAVGHLVLSTPHPAGGAATWRSTDLEQGYNPFMAIACPSDQLCVGIDAGGNLITSSAPSRSASAWTVAPLAFGSQISPMPSLACPSVSWCAATTSGGLLITSTDPTNAGAWSSSAFGLNDVSCPTATFCAGSDSGGAIHISANPSGGQAAWSSRQIGAAPQCENQYCTDDALTAVSCPSMNLCATTDGRYLWVSTDPAAADAAWTRSSLPNPAQKLYCPTDSLCLTASGAALEETTDPGDSAPRWTALSLPKIVIPAPFGPAIVPLISGLSCVNAELCVAVDTWGGYAFVGNPADPNHWTATKIDYSILDHASLTGVSCTPTGRCVAIDGSGNVIVGTARG